LEEFLRGSSEHDNYQIVSLTHLSDQATWRWCFYINLPVGAVALIVLQFSLRIKRDNNPERRTLVQRILQIDLIGAAILIPAIICLLLPLQWGGSTYPWKSGRIIGLFVGFAVLTIIFVLTQLKLGDKGTLPPRLFKDRNVVLAMAFAFFFGAGFFAIIYYLAIYLYASFYLQIIKCSKKLESHSKPHLLVS
jgi:predicted MFS family arabinose efflux permease